MILRKNPVNGLPEEIIVCLYGIKSPNFNDRMDEKVYEDYFGWESKELLKVKARNIPLYVFPVYNNQFEFYQKLIKL